MTVWKKFCADYFGFVNVCYDNEAYMNTGIQLSKATPAGASTTSVRRSRKQVTCRFMIYRYAEKTDL